MNQTFKKMMLKVVRVIVRKNYLLKILTNFWKQNNKKIKKLNKLRN